MSTSEGSDSAAEAGLRHVSDDRPGYARRRCGKGFRYLDLEGHAVRDPRVQKRLRELAIPPAWTQVWICADPRGHLQATGRDARRRKQYIYHPEFEAIRSQTKYDRLAGFAVALPRIRRQVARDLRRRRLSRERVLALVVHLLDVLRLRVGNPEYARQNKSYGVTTLQDDHLRIRGNLIHFAFKGKSGVPIRIDLRDRRLARLLQQLQDLPGQDIFQYLDHRGEQQTIASHDVNDYLRSIVGEEYTAKDLRTWSGTVLAASTLCSLEPADSPTARKRSIREAIKLVAEELNNTPAVCRRYYVHPLVLAAYEDDTLGPRLRRGRPSRRDCMSGPERAVARMLAEMATPR